jgi:glycosyltransferase involved in cell wall biosynthesis
MVDRYFPQLSRFRIILFLSRIHPKKGLDTLAHTWGNLAPKFPEWHLLIVGHDHNNHWSEVEAIFKSYNIIDRYTFAGHLTGEARLAAYSASELFVLPTYSENFGIVVAEALMAKLPVITTNMTPWDEIVVQKCGWIIQPCQDQLMNAMYQAFRLSEGALREMGQRGRDFVQNSLSWESVATQMKVLYQWMLNGENKPDFVYSLKGSKIIRLQFKKPKRIL